MHASVLLHAVPLGTLARTTQTCIAACIFLQLLTRTFSGWSALFKFCCSYTLESPLSLWGGGCHHASFELQVTEPRNSLIAKPKSRPNLWGQNHRSVPVSDEPYTRSYRSLVRKNCRQFALLSGRRADDDLLPRRRADGSLRLHNHHLDGVPRLSHPEKCAALDELHHAANARRIQARPDGPGDYPADFLAGADHVLPHDLRSVPELGRVLRLRHHRGDVDGLRESPRHCGVRWALPKVPVETVVVLESGSVDHDGE